jgi:hypothetical protein
LRAADFAAAGLGDAGEFFGVLAIVGRTSVDWAKLPVATLSDWPARPL